MEWLVKRLAVLGVFVALAALFSSAAEAQEVRNLQEDGAYGNWVLPEKVPAPLVFVLHTFYGTIQPEDLAEFQNRQRKMVARALECLAPGGKLVYATCSLEREENEEAVEGLPVVETQMRLPVREPGDGFFAAVIALQIDVC